MIVTINYSVELVGIDGIPDGAPHGYREEDFDIEAEYTPGRAAIIRMDPIDSSPPEPEEFDIIQVTGYRQVTVQNEKGEDEVRNVPVLFSEDEFKLLLALHPYTAERIEYILDDIRMKAIERCEPDEPDYDPDDYRDDDDRADYIHEGHQDPW